MSSALELKEIGDAHMKSKDFDEAIIAYTQAIALDPAGFVLYSNRSAAYYSKGDYQIAHDDAIKCIELNPSWVRGYTRKGNSLTALEKYVLAEEAFNQGLRHSPDDDGCKKGLTFASKKADENLSKEIKRLELEKEDEKVLGQKGGCSECGNSSAKMLCGSCNVAVYCNTKCQQKHWKKHKPKCKQLQKHPNDAAFVQKDLANQYFSDAATAENAERAIAFYRLSAENGSVQAAYNLSVMLTHELTALYSKVNDGDSVQIGLKEIRENDSHLKGVAMASASAAANENVLDEKKMQEAKENAAEVIKWYKKCTDVGHGGAMYNLATVYQNGILVPRDYSKAQYWFEQAQRCQDENVRNGAKMSLEMLPLIIGGQFGAPSSLFH